MTLSSQLLWNYWSNFHETWYVDRTSYGVMHIGRKFWSPHFCWSYVPWNLENTYTRGYQKVRRLMRWNQYLLSYAYKFSREYKTTNVLSVVKIWAIYVDNQSFYHQKQFIWYGNPAQSPLSFVTFHNVVVFHCYSLYFKTLLAKSS